MLTGGSYGTSSQNLMVCRRRRHTLFKQIIQAMQYCRHKGIVLLDLKSENTVVDASGRHPFVATSNRQVKKLIKQGTYDIPPHVSEGAQSLIHEILMLDPMQRPTIDQVPPQGNPETEAGVGEGEEEDCQIHPATLQHTMLLLATVQKKSGSSGNAQRSLTELMDSQKTLSCVDTDFMLWE
ncbi:putative sperm motility kinase W [Sciurus carolinensis]|uniref:non-specific serine/threonine protein kinase n=1 Tax=Sciurus carolinensis TaxID=30640 RepID=A0AA41NB15_SCICA|nr:putative sperm motility kinase W [Sciurus carolinensis]